MMFFLLGSAITRDNFRKLFGLFYFSLRNQQADLTSGSTQLIFKYTLSGVPNAYCLILNEEILEIYNASGRVKITV